MLRKTDNAKKLHYILSMIRKSPLFLALGLNLFFLFLYLAFGQVRHGSLDDYFMSGVLTGAYGGEYDVHMYFVNSAYGYFLKPFYWLFPKVGWYFIFELVGTFAAFTTFSYFLIRQLNVKWGALVSALLLASLTPDFYFQLSFTQCATIYTAAGLLAFFFGASENKKRFLAIGGLFFVAGSVMRHEGFLLGIPWMVLLLLVLWRNQKHFTKKTLVAVCLVVAAIYGLRAHDRNLFSEGDYKYYAAYQPIRAYFGDGAFYDRESTYDELEERGMSGPDFYMLKAWMFYDTDVFYKDSLEPIKVIAQNNLYTPNYRRMPVSFFLAVSNALTRTSGWCWFLFCFLLILSKSKKSAVYPWVSLGFVAMSIGYLLLVNRLVYHVESGIWLYAIVSAIPFLNGNAFCEKPVFPKWNKILTYGLGMFAVVFMVIGISNYANLKGLSFIHSVKTSKDWKDFLLYAKENPEKVFILSFDRYKELGFQRNPPYVSIKPGSFDNIFSWGYWNIHLPAMKQELAKRGVDNPIRDIVHDNVYLMEDGNRPSLKLFYESHYHKSLQVDTVKTFGKLMLLKYHLPRGSEDNFHE